MSITVCRSLLHFTMHRTAFLPHVVVVDPVQDLVARQVLYLPLDGLVKLPVLGPQLKNAVLEACGGQACNVKPPRVMKASMQSEGSVPCPSLLHLGFANVL